MVTWAEYTGSPMCRKALKDFDNGRFVVGGLLDIIQEANLLGWRSDDRVQKAQRYLRKGERHD